MRGAPGLGAVDFQPILAAFARGDYSLLNRIPPGTMYLAIRAPLGTAIFDPFAASQDPETQRILQAAGIELELGFGRPPASLVAEAAQNPLFANLKVYALIAAAGLGALLFAPRLVPWIVGASGAYWLLTTQAASA